MSTNSRHQVTVTLPRPAGSDVLVPPGAQAIAERAASAAGAGGLLTVWTARQAVLSMVIDAARETDALSAGWAVARALGGGHGTSVEATPGPAH
jgi:hypothetical protein